MRAAERVFARSGFSGATMARIAEASGLPKANLRYYFGGKAELYRSVLTRTLADWLEPTDALNAQAEPRAALERYVRAKMALARLRPDASNVFANELLHGAPAVGDTLRIEMRDMVRRTASVIDGWIAAGRMVPVDSTHLFFTIWAATQTYADFDVQVRAVVGRGAGAAAEHARAAEHVVALILRVCGLG